MNATWVRRYCDVGTYDCGRRTSPKRRSNVANKRGISFESFVYVGKTMVVKKLTLQISVCVNKEKVNYMI